jgi:hypothetical protein
LTQYQGSNGHSATSDVVLGAIPSQRIRS